jgi:hypothetical protein
VSLTPNTLTITLPTGSNAGTGTVTLTNTAAAGGAQVAVTSVAFFGGSASSYFFNSAANTCSNTALAPGASCTVSVRFNNVVGFARGTNRNGTITFIDNAAGTGSQTGSLVGFATP